MQNLIGIDEAGRGALAGPLYIGACELKKDIPNLNDSKKLSHKQREKLYFEIIKNSNYLILAFSNTQIDALGLSKCLSKALKIIQIHFKNKNFLFDGNTNFNNPNIKTMIKADLHIKEVSAASILAKVSRDKFMQDVANKFPLYKFEKHKGYGTKLHIDIIKELGYSSLHRKSFRLKNLDYKEQSLF